ncbi:DUF4262 domain-containing protein [Amycolatopsis carbonis]|uniref:DUF4262 domain-containing protein n=1 Tax=Amycolatopsis carbonis TaxID=715471 RepID=A0A9Y2IL70_9PSEU|nr:DUF4262 domain-containing protein [Amycolatopsis sp. 2-15]WIX82147.1 DUF4262 domain-containing protein [Amycolatopsis sp. 2-15]
MCEQCEGRDNTGRPGERYLAEILDRVQEYGWCVQGVLGTGPRPPWAYTVGLTAHGLPELVVTGLPPHASILLLGAAAERSFGSGPPRPGEVFSLRGLPSVEVVALTAPSAHLSVAVSLYGHDIRALQLVHADEAGRFPWSPSYRDGLGGQPVLGTRSDD